MKTEECIDLINGKIPLLNQHETMVLKPSEIKIDHFSICIRKHDLSGIDYTSIATVTKKMALKINEKVKEISFLYDVPKEKEKMNPGQMLNEEERKFLSSLKSNGEPTKSNRIPYASPSQERVRAKAKRMQWVRFDRKAWGWILLPEGNKALNNDKIQKQEKKHID